MSANVGRDLGDIAGIGRKLRVKIRSEADKVFRTSQTAGGRPYDRLKPEKKFIPNWKS